MTSGSSGSVAGSGGVTFGSLNNFWKVNASALKLWAQVLRAVERSQLLMLASEGSHRQGVLKVFAQEGVAPERVTFVAGRPRQQYLELCHQIDMGLSAIAAGEYLIEITAKGGTGEAKELVPFRVVS